MFQPPVPEAYLRLPAAELHERIAAAKAELGARLTILGHHYQRDDVIRYADFTGDSLKLAQLSMSRPEADFIVFCGVHFMAEGADILARPGQQVLLPDLGAGCSMADMAGIEDVEECWDALRSLCPSSTLVPMTYVNSAASLKALVGHNDGCCCTSGNADSVIGWALNRAAGDHDGCRDKLVFFPDQHLGRNTCYKLGVPLDQMVIWDPTQELGGNSPEALRRARVVLWKGHCSVHTRMTTEHVRQVRAEYPGVKVIVHPECPFDTVQAADLAGSTEFIIKHIKEAEPGTIWAVGTEIHLVQRLARQHPEQTIVSLDDCRCQCATMFRISPQHLAWMLEELVAGRVHNRITVDQETAHWARKSLDRMLELSPMPTAAPAPRRQQELVPGA
ncbi:MAG: quinolinate synthase NadA [Armatimonadetes bacterium]|nr:quinolinate synthase NadA [Armatimonadota bacterium]